MKISIPEGDLEIFQDLGPLGNGHKDTAAKCAPGTAKTAFFELFWLGFWGSPRFSILPPRFSHGSLVNPHGSPTVLWSIPTVLPRFFGQPPRFSHGSGFAPRPNHWFLGPKSPRFSHGSLCSPHGSPTVLCAAPTVLPQFSVQPPRFSHGSLTRPRFSHGSPSVLAPRQRFSHGFGAHLATRPFFPNRMTLPKVSQRDFLQKRTFRKTKSSPRQSARAESIQEVFP